MKAIRALAAALAVLLLTAGAAGACPVCFGESEGPMIDAARLGTWLLLGVVVAVQGAFVAFFLYLRRQARRAAAASADPAGEAASESEWTRYREKRAARMLEAR